MGQRAYREALALGCTEGARRRLLDIYGANLAVVYFIQRRPDGPVKIGHAQRLTGRMTDFLCAGPELPIIRAVAPGNRAHEHWFHRRHADRRLDRREWFDDAETVVRDAYAFGELHAAVYGATGDLTAAVVQTVMIMDPFIADFFRLYRNGATQRELCELTGLSPGALRSKLTSLRTMGFDIAYRRAYGPRGEPKQQRGDSPMGRGRARLIG